MDSARTMEGVMDDIVGEIFKDDMFKAVSVVSKAGLMISGRSLDQRPETFSAMAAVMHSAAESTSAGQSDSFSHVVAVFENSRLYISSVSPTLLLAVRVGTDASEQDVLDSFQRFSSRTKEELMWLH